MRYDYCSSTTTLERDSHGLLERLGNTNGSQARNSWAGKRRDQDAWNRQYQPPRICGKKCYSRRGLSCKTDFKSLDVYSDAGRLAALNAAKPALNALAAPSAASFMSCSVACACAIAFIKIAYRAACSFMSFPRGYAAELRLKNLVTAAHTRASRPTLTGSIAGNSSARRGYARPHLQYRSVMAFPWMILLRWQAHGRCQAEQP